MSIDEVNNMMFVVMNDNRTVLSVCLENEPPKLLTEYKMDSKISKIKPYQKHYRVVSKHNGDIMVYFCGS